MVYLISAFRVQFLIWTLLIASVNSNQIKGHLPDFGIISSFLEQFIKPYIEHIKNGSGSSLPRAAAEKETKIEKVIRLKVSELRHMLQDIDDNPRPKIETDDNLTLKGNDETTIIEFVPQSKKYKNKDKQNLRAPSQEKDSFQKNINKYKQLKQTIIKRLDKEKTSSSTKRLITRTLDEMIAQLIERQCTWKSVDTTGLKNRLFRNSPVEARKSMNKLHKLTNDEWMNLRKQFLDFLQYSDGMQDEFMKQFHDFFSNVINDTWNLSDRYKVRCQLVQVDDNDKRAKQLLREDKLVEKNQCDSFKVCGDELKDFLTNFYSHLNDTAVSTFRNYAAMYVRDVNTDIGVDKDIVVSVLEHLSNTAERKVSKIFRKEIETFTLDINKKKGANIQHINDFITATTDEVKKVLKKNLDYELGAMKNKLFSTVKDDLSVNLRVDMDNLGKLFVDRICALFVLCNGKYSARRHDKPWTIIPQDNSDNVYVKVQLTLDDEFKDNIAKSGAYPRPWQGQDMTHRFLKTFGIEDQRRYSYINVTRTTIITTNETPPSVHNSKTFGGITLMVNNYI